MGKKNNKKKADNYWDEEFEKDQQLLAEENKEETKEKVGTKDDDDDDFENDEIIIEDDEDSEEDETENAKKSKNMNSIGNGDDDEEEEEDDEEDEEERYTHGELSSVINDVVEYLQIKRKKEEDLPKTKEDLKLRIERFCTVKRKLPIELILSFMIETKILIHSINEKTKKLEALHFAENWKEIYKQKSTKKLLMKEHPLIASTLMEIIERMIKEEGEREKMPEDAKEIAELVAKYCLFDFVIPVDDVIEEMIERKIISIGKSSLVSKDGKGNKAIEKIVYNMAKLDKLSKKKSSTNYCLTFLFLMIFTSTLVGLLASINAI